MIFRKATILLLLFTFITTTSQTLAQPTITTVSLTLANTTNVNNVGWNFTFSEPVSGVTTSSFTLAPIGVTAALDSVLPLLGNQTWTVSATGVSGDGTLGADLTDPTGIMGTSSPLTQTATGPLYIVDNTPPSVVSITRLDASPTSASTVNFSIVFSEPIFSLSAVNFSPSGTSLGGTVDNTVAPTPNQSVWTAAISGISGSGLVGLDLTDTSNVTDAAGNPLSSDFTSGEQYEIDQQGPQLICITRLDTSPTSATSVTFLVEFDEPAANVQVANFTINGTGTSGTIISVLPSVTGTTWTVTVDSIQGQGLLTLDLSNFAGITDQQLNPAGPGAIGPGCESYVIDRVNPEVVSIALPDNNPTSASLLTFTVTFSESVTTASLIDFSLITQGTTTGTITGVDTAGDITTVTISGVSGSGLLCLQVNAPSTITDLIGNPLTGIPVTSPCFSTCFDYGPLTNLTPADGSTTSSSADFLRWTPPSPALTFHVYFDGLFKGTTTDTAFAIPRPLFPGLHTYLIDIDGACTSGTEISFNVLNAPILISPADGFESCIIPRRFRWRGVSGATTYTLFIDNVSQGITTGTRTFINTPNLVLGLGSHSWYVIAENEFGQTSSATNTFIINEDDTNAPIVLRTNGTVHDILTVGNEVYIGGDFDSVMDTSGTWKTRSNVAMFSGSPLELSDWAPEVNGIVYTLENAGASLLVGGDFTRINGIPIARIGSFDFGTTVPSASFRPGANSTVRAIEAVGNTVYYGGDFTKIGEQVYNFSTPGIISIRLAVADLQNTSNPIVVNLSPNASVRDLLFDGSHLFVAGVFSTIGGQANQGLSQLDRVTTALLRVSADFTTQTAQFPADLYVYSIARLNNTLYVGGSFNKFMGEDRSNAAALELGNVNTSASLEPWDPRPNSAVHRLRINSSTGNSIFLGGTFTTLGNELSTYLVGVDSVEGLPVTCSFNADRSVHAIGTTGDGKVYVGGEITLAGAKNQPPP